MVQNELMGIKRPKHFNAANVGKEIYFQLKVY